MAFCRKITQSADALYQYGMNKYSQAKNYGFETFSSVVTTAKIAKRAIPAAIRAIRGGVLDRTNEIGPLVYFSMAGFAIAYINETFSLGIVQRFDDNISAKKSMQLFFLTFFCEATIKQLSKFVNVYNIAHFGYPYDPENLVESRSLKLLKFSYMKSCDIGGVICCAVTMRPLITAVIGESSRITSVVIIASLFEQTLNSISDAVAYKRSDSGACFACELIGHYVVSAVVAIKLTNQLDLQGAITIATIIFSARTFLQMHSPRQQLYVPHRVIQTPNLFNSLPSAVASITTMQMKRITLLPTIFNMLNTSYGPTRWTLNKNFYLKFIWTHYETQVTREVRQQGVHSILAWLAMPERPRELAFPRDGILPLIEEYNDD